MILTCIHSYAQNYRIWLLRIAPACAWTRSHPIRLIVFQQGSVQLHLGGGKMEVAHVIGWSNCSCVWRWDLRAWWFLLAATVWRNVRAGGGGSRARWVEQGDSDRRLEWRWDTEDGTVEIDQKWRYGRSKGVHALSTLLYLFLIKIYKIGYYWSCF
jgi:hypothetical protein